MITFVYCCICLLIVCCQTTRIGSEENYINNDSPDTLPKVDVLKYKMGADVSMKCNNNNKHHKDSITWDFKSCDSNDKGINCDDENMYQLDYSEGQWKKLDNNRKKRKLEIRNSTEKDIGLYRCLYNDTIIKIYVVDLVVPANYLGPPPEILSVVASPNSTIVPSWPVVIQCKVKSVKPPEVRWFKECRSPNCEVNSRVPYNGNCYCSLTTSNDAYPRSNNIYISKHIIYDSSNIDSGTYVCVVVTAYGVSLKNVTIKVGDMNINDSENTGNSFWLLFLIPLFFVFVPVTIWLVFYRRKKKSRRHFNEHQKRQLIQPVVVEL